MKRIDLDPTTPVVVLGAGLGALAIMRSLGSLGVQVICVSSNDRAHPLYSRFCAASEVLGDPVEDPAAYLAGVLRIAEGLPARPVLFWTSDELALFCTEHAAELAPHYRFAQVPHALVHRLQDKRLMSDLAESHGVPVPEQTFPRSLEEVEVFAVGARYPIMLKGIVGSRLEQLTGEKMRLVENEEELLFHYQRMEDPVSPNLILQEAIPGDDDEVYIFNGYFDAESECLNPFTGHKIRQHPIHKGCASLCINRWNDEVAELTMRFMKEIGYQGILDIGYRLDPRDGRYKVLDINPRIGQAFRIFVGEDGMDVARDMYLDLTDQPRPRTQPREGRRWVIEDWDLVSSKDYWREGTLTFGRWAASWAGVEEGAWWSWSDPVPFFVRMSAFVGRVLRGAVARRMSGGSQGRSHGGSAPKVEAKSI